MSTAKNEVQSLLQKLPDDCTLEDVQYHCPTMGVKPSPSGEGGLLQIAVGVSAVDCILDGLDIAAWEETRAPEDLANAWHTIPHFAQGDNPKETTILDAYKAVRMKPLADHGKLVLETRVLRG
ncbi:MAG: hypothetical protein KBE65_20425 [Phycisphaerae bacterium]|nr:hypothetical protein [Phycisphaerae bacterium]